MGKDRAGEDKRANLKSRLAQRINDLAVHHQGMPPATTHANARIAFIRFMVAKLGRSNSKVCLSNPNGIYLIVRGRSTRSICYLLNSGSGLMFYRQDMPESRHR